LLIFAKAFFPRSFRVADGHAMAFRVTDGHARACTTTTSNRCFVGVF
jgi:hypothetical protein